VAFKGSYYLIASNSYYVLLVQCILLVFKKPFIKRQKKTALSKAEGSSLKHSIQEGLLPHRNPSANGTIF
jgi:hypothetical protein